MKKIVVIGSMNMDMVVETKRMPLPGETVEGKRIVRVPGGKGANQAYTIGKLGGKAEMIGAVGDDTYGEILTSNLASVGVGTSGITSLNGISTGQTFITVSDDGENAIIVIGGANGKVTEELVLKNRDMILSADIVMMQFEIPVDTVMAVRELVRGGDQLLIVDPAPAVPDLPDHFWDGIDFIKPNETELSILTGMPAGSPKEAEIAAQVYLKKGVKNVLVSMGASGCLLVNASGASYFPSRKVHAVDTTAAGDSFAAAFAYGLSRGDAVKEAIRFAQVVSSLVVTRKGAQTSIPDLAEVMAVVSADENRRMGKAI